MIEKIPKTVKPWMRLIILIVGSVVLGLISLRINGSIIPISNQAANIFQGGLLLVVLGSLFLEDKFTRPADAMVNGLTSLIAIIPVFPQQNILTWIIIGYCVFVFVTGAVSIALVDQKKRWIKNICYLLFKISTILGKSNIIFSIIFLFSVFSFYGFQTKELASLIVFWGIYLALWPLKIPNIIQGFLTHSKVSEEVGTILRMETPDLIRIKLLPGVSWPSKTLHIACTGDGKKQYILPLYSNLQNDIQIGTGYCLVEVNKSFSNLSRGKVYKAEIDQSEIDQLIKDHFLLEKATEPMGLITVNSRIGKINISTWRPELCHEGLLVFCECNGEKIFYQITDGNTQEETLIQNKHGFQVAEAMQLGIIKDGKKFVKYPWVPVMNTPVFIYSANSSYESQVLAPNEFMIGKIPGSSLNVIANIKDMLTLHTAILGVTGTGKSELAFDIIRNAISKEFKVFCVDLTGMYEVALEDLRPYELNLGTEDLEKLEKIIFEVDRLGYQARKEKLDLKNLDEKFRKNIEESVKTFLTDKDRYLGLFNLPTISNSKAIILITEMYLSAIFEYAKDHNDHKPIFVVLEEAHTIVPETKTMGINDFDSKAMVAKIAQIALQGRKFNVGLLVIAQRTATVSKTVLTQCNTIISFSCFDNTSLDFLGNFFGKEHTNLVPNLPFLQAVAFGKGIECERPIIVEIPFSKEKTVSPKQEKRKNDDYDEIPS